MAANYPARLSEHLREISKEKRDDMRMYMEWYFDKTEDTGEASSLCPCGKQGLRYLCYIKNKHTRNTTYVGTTCIELFDKEMKEVLKLVHGLVSVGIRGQYKGISNTNQSKHRFEIRANTNLVKKSQFLKSQVKYVPIYQKGNEKWEMQLFFDISVPAGLHEGQFYRLRMKSSRWEQDYGTGITFRVIQCSVD